METITTRLHGELEIDHERGVIYFHHEVGYTVLRIQGIPVPIPSYDNDNKVIGMSLLDYNLSK